MMREGFGGTVNEVTPADLLVPTHCLSLLVIA